MKMMYRILFFACIFSLLTSQSISATTTTTTTAALTTTSRLSTTTTTRPATTTMSGTTRTTSTNQYVLSWGSPLYSATFDGNYFPTPVEPNVLSTQQHETSALLCGIDSVLLFMTPTETAPVTNATLPTTAPTTTTATTTTATTTTTAITTTSTAATSSSSAPTTSSISTTTTSSNSSTASGTNTTTVAMTSTAIPITTTAAPVLFQYHQSILMWGRWNGTLGTGNATLSNSALTLITTSDSIAGVALGGNHGAYYTSAGFMYAWGKNDVGQLGLGGVIDRPTPTLISYFFQRNIPVRTMTCGAQHTLAIAGLLIDLYSWGLNRMTGLGQADGYRPTPTLVSSIRGPLRDVSDFKNIYFYSCALANAAAIHIKGKNDTIYAWGDNSYGQLGFGHTSDIFTPTVMTVLNASVTIYNVAFGKYHSLFTGPAGLFAVGKNHFGQLGLGDRVARTTPTLVTMPKSAQPFFPDTALFAVGETHSLFTTGYENILFGMGDRAALGVEEFFIPTTPTLIDGMSVQQVCATKNSSAAAAHIFSFSHLTLPPPTTRAPGYCAPFLVANGVVFPDYAQIEGSYANISCNVGFYANSTTYSALHPKCLQNSEYETPTKCLDVDECELGLAHCNVHADCTNIPGTFECACSGASLDDWGWEGDGFNCTEIVPGYFDPIYSRYLSYYLAGTIFFAVINCVYWVWEGGGSALHAEAVHSRVSLFSRGAVSVLSHAQLLAIFADFTEESTKSYPHWATSIEVYRIFNFAPPNLLNLDIGPYVQLSECADKTPKRFVVRIGLLLVLLIILMIPRILRAMFFSCIRVPSHIKHFWTTFVHLLAGRKRIGRDRSDKRKDPTTWELFPVLVFPRWEIPLFSAFSLGIVQSALEASQTSCHSWASMGGVVLGLIVPLALILILFSVWRNAILESACWFDLYRRPTFKAIMRSIRYGRWRRLQEEVIRWRRAGTWISSFAQAPKTEDENKEAEELEKQKAQGTKKRTKKEKHQVRNHAATLRAAHETYLGFEYYLSTVEPLIRDYRAETFLGFFFFDLIPPIAIGFGAGLPLWITTRLGILMSLFIGRACLLMYNKPFSDRIIAAMEVFSDLCKGGACALLLGGERRDMAIYLSSVFAYLLVLFSSAIWAFMVIVTIVGCIFVSCTQPAANKRTINKIRVMDIIHAWKHDPQLEERRNNKRGGGVRWVEDVEMESKRPVTRIGERVAQGHRAPPVPTAPRRVAPWVPREGSSPSPPRSPPRLAPRIRSPIRSLALLSATPKKVSRMDPLDAINSSSDDERHNDKGLGGVRVLPTTARPSGPGFARRDPAPVLIHAAKSNKVVPMAKREATPASAARTQAPLTAPRDLSAPIMGPRDLGYLF